MNLVPPFSAALGGLVLFFLPGLAFWRRLPEADREAIALDEAAFLVVAVSVMASAWLGLLLAEAGRFSLTTAASILAALSGAALLTGRSRGGSLLPRPGSAASLAPAALVLILALALQARPTEYLVGGRDPGTYVAAMGLIGRTGGIVYTDPAVVSIPPEDVELFYRNPGQRDFSWGRFMGFPLERPSTGRVFPAFFHLFPVFGAFLYEALGVKGALATPVVFGVLGTLAAFFALRKVLGATAALLAAVLLCVNVIQVWFARYPVSESLSQFLVFVAILALARFEDSASAAFGALAGAALGLSLLVRIDSLLIAAALALYLTVRISEGRWSVRHAAPLLVPFGLLALHAALHAAFWSRKYLVDIATRKYWRQPPAVWIAAALLAVLFAALVPRLGRRLARGLAGHHDTLRRAVTGAVVLAALYAYFLRPYLSAWAGGDGNDPALALGSPGVLGVLGFRHLAAHDAQAFYRLGWFVSPLGLLLGVLGLALALREWQPRYLFLVLTALVSSAFYFYKIRVYNDYFFALRRDVPVILPSLLGFAALLLTRFASGGPFRRAAGGVLGLVLVGLNLRETLPLRRHVDWRGAVAFVGDLARKFGPEDVVIFEQPRSIHLLSLPLWAIHGVNVLELARFNPDPDKLSHLIRAFRGRYRNIYFAHTYSTDLCGVFLERVQPLAFPTWEWERAYGHPPRGPEPRFLRFTVSRVVLPEELRVPALPEVDIGGSDDVQVSGFFEKESEGNRSVRWTGSCASVYLPGVSPGGTVTITASGNQRPQGATVRASLSGAPLGTFAVDSGWGDYALRLPDPLPPGPPLLRLDVPAWRPAKALPGSSDTRDLGVMLDRITLEGPKRPPKTPKGP